MELIFTVAPMESIFNVKYLENVERCDVGLQTRNHHHDLWPWMTLNRARSRLHCRIFASNNRGRYVRIMAPWLGLRESSFLRLKYSVKLLIEYTGILLTLEVVIIRWSRSNGTCLLIQACSTTMAWKESTIMPDMRQRNPYQAKSQTCNLQNSHARWKLHDKQTWKFAYIFITVSYTHLTLPTKRIV